MDEIRGNLATGPISKVAKEKTGVDGGGHTKNTMYDEKQNLQSDKKE
jgi:hypothetical protein